MIRTRVTGLLAAGLLLLAATPAGAAGPADVTLRVEGRADTLLARTTVRTTTSPVNKDGQAGHDCTGTSVAGALEVATAGAWTGSWSTGLGYFVTVRVQRVAQAADRLRPVNMRDDLIRSAKSAAAQAKAVVNDLRSDNLAS